MANTCLGCGYYKEICPNKHTTECEFTVANIEIKKTTVYKLELTREEMGLIKALLQNPHPDYMRVPETEAACKDLFYTFKEAWID